MNSQDGSFAQGTGFATGRFGSVGGGPDIGAFGAIDNTGAGTFVTAFIGDTVMVTVGNVIGVYA
jgi:hypothetical protein